MNQLFKYGVATRRASGRVSSRELWSIKLGHITIVGALFFTLFWFGLSSERAKAQEVDWLKNISNANLDVWFTALDADSNLYMSGVFENSTVLGSMTLTSAGSDDVFIAKVDSHGNHLWAHRIGGIRNDHVGGITVDYEGNIYVTGQFWGEIYFDTSATLNTENSWYETFIAKYDTDGDFVWVQQIGAIDSNPFSFPRPIIADDAGNIYLTGIFLGTIFVGSETLTATGHYDIFVAKYDSDGNFVWVNQSKGTSALEVDGIDYLDGRLYITGAFLLTTTFGTTQLTSSGSTDMFLAAFDGSGAPLWAERAGGPRDESGVDVAIDNEGNIYVSGYFQGTADFGPFTLASVPEYNSDGFLAKYDSAGNVLWAEKFGGESTERGDNVSLDGDGYPYIIGYSSSKELTFDGIKLANPASSIFVARYDKGSGSALWATQANSQYGVFGAALVTNQAGYLYMTGKYTHQLKFGALTLDANNGSEYFMARLLPGRWNDLIFSDSFEIGDFSGWTNYSSDLDDLTVTPDAAMVGDLGLSAVLDDNTPIGTRDEVPTHEKHYRARFYFDPNSLSMGQDENHVIFFGYSGNDLRRPVLRLELRYHDGGYQLRSAIFNDSTIWRHSGWFAIGDASHLIELDWQAATAPDANNGSLTTWVDEIERSALTGIDNNSRRIDTVRLGAVAGIDPQTHGAYYFDGFESRRTTYIGADLTVSVPMAVPAAVVDANEMTAWTESDESEPEEAALMQEVLEYAEEVEHEDQSPRIFIPWASD